MTVRELASALVACPSVTPDEAGCSEIICGFLREHGFEVRVLAEGGVTNLWATRGSGPTFCLYGHMDVVPPGPLEAWDSDPFTPTERDGHLYGRGTADMKGPLAALLIAATQIHSGRVAVLVTSDEEGPGTYGVEWVLPQLLADGEQIDLPGAIDVGVPVEFDEDDTEARARRRTHPLNAGGAIHHRFNGEADERLGFLGGHPVRLGHDRSLLPRRPSLSRDECQGAVGSTSSAFGGRAPRARFDVGTRLARSNGLGSTPAAEDLLCPTLCLTAKRSHTL